jgi:hypothetical protein
MTVPVIIVITKFDLYVADLMRHFGMKKNIGYQSAEDDFIEKYGPQLGKNGITKGLIPHVLVSSMFISEVTSSALTSCSNADRHLSTASPDHKGEYT